MLTDTCHFAFESLKALFAASAPVLAAPDFNRPFKLAVDASDAGVGVVLLQEDSLGGRASCVLLFEKNLIASGTLLHHRKRSVGSYLGTGSFWCLSFLQPDPSGLHRV